MFSIKVDIMILLAMMSMQRLLELRLAERNRRIAMDNGGVEFGANHYWIFIVMHFTWMISWSSEGLLLGHESVWSGVWLMIFVIAQLLRYSAISALGEQWNTRIIIQPHKHRVTKGIYKYLNHPNYIAVVLELASVPMIFSAWRTALIYGVVNALVLLVIRIPKENEALAQLMSHSKE